MITRISAEEAAANRAAEEDRAIHCLLATAQGMVNQREAAADMFWQDYTLVSWDEAERVAVILSPNYDAKAGRYPTYTVDLERFTCTCRDFTGRCEPMNARLGSAGYGGGVCCRHIPIAARLVATRNVQPAPVRRSSVSQAEKMALWG